MATLGSEESTKTDYASQFKAAPDASSVRAILQRWKEASIEGPSSQDLSYKADLSILKGQTQILEVLTICGWSPTTETGPGLINLALPVPPALHYVLTLLGESDAVSVSVRDSLGVTALASAAYFHPFTSMAALLEHGAEVRGSSALQAAATSKIDQLDKLQLLVDHGADVNGLELELPWMKQNKSIPSQNLQTALHGARKWGFERAAEWLLQHGADAELQNSAGENPDDVKENAERKIMLLRGWSAPLLSEEAKEKIRAKGNESVGGRERDDGSRED